MLTEKSYSQENVVGVNGNVGIGTTSPGNKLQVSANANGHGVIKLTGNTSGTPNSQLAISPFAAGYSDFATTGDFVIRTNTEDLILSARSTGAIRLGTGTADLERMTVLNNGNIGIGVTNPAQKLVVNGTICAKEIRVSLSGSPCWADYVFSADYKLTPLLELEGFLKSNKHLPGIPSAAEVEKAGVDVGAMQAKLLEKIEELTLYVIELKKENDQLKKEVKEIKSNETKPTEIKSTETK